MQLQSALISEKEMMMMINLELTEHDAYKILSLVEQEAQSPIFRWRIYWQSLAQYIRQNIEQAYALEEAPLAISSQIPATQAPPSTIQKSSQPTVEENIFFLETANKLIIPC